MMTTQIVALQIDHVEVRQDSDGRYCLNDLHQAAGGESKHQPGKWLENQQTRELADALQQEITGIPVILAKQGLGTFVAWSLVKSTTRLGEK